MTPPPDLRTRRFRWSTSVLIAAAALGPLLVGSAVYTQRTVRNAADIVLQAEAAGWVRALENRLRELKTPPSEDVLVAFLEESREAGLRYVVRIGRDGRIEAGVPAAPVGDLAEGTVTWVGNRVRYVGVERPLGRRRPPRPPLLLEAPGEGGGRGGPEGGGRGGPDGGGRRGPPLLVVEFEPQVFPHMMRAAHRTLALGAATGATIMLLAVWVWLSTRRRLALEREAERARHLAALGEMSAVLAHEIRNPLASLKGHAQLLEENLQAPGSERARGKAGRIVDEAVRIEKITTDLLAFVRQGELDRAPADLGDLVRLSVEEIVPPERLRLQLPAVPVRVSVDAARLRQVFENIARNAVQAGDGPVEIAVAGGPQQVTVTIRDQGPGIPEGQGERIFEPFVTTRTRGTGLGLSIARRIVERHGGTVVAGNHPRGGAVFRVILPAR